MIPSRLGEQQTVNRARAVRTEPCASADLLQDDCVHCPVVRSLIRFVVCQVDSCRFTEGTWCKIWRGSFSQRGHAAGSRSVPQRRRLGRSRSGSFSRMHVAMALNEIRLQELKLHHNPFQRDPLFWNEFALGTESCCRLQHFTCADFQLDDEESTQFLRCISRCPRLQTPDH